MVFKQATAKPFGSTDNRATGPVGKAQNRGLPSPTRYGLVVTFGPRMAFHVQVDPRFLFPNLFEHPTAWNTSFSLKQSLWALWKD
jgi:hypothetical protein